MNKKVVPVYRNEANIPALLAAVAQAVGSNLTVRNLLAHIVQGKILPSSLRLK